MCDVRSKYSCLLYIIIIIIIIIITTITLYLGLMKNKTLLSRTKLCPLTSISKNIFSVCGSIFHSFIHTFAKLQKATDNFITSLCLLSHLSAWHNSALTGWIFMKFDISGFLKNLLRKFKFH